MPEQAMEKNGNCPADDDARGEFDRDRVEMEKLSSTLVPSPPAKPSADEL